MRRVLKKILGQLEVSFLVFLILGSIKQSNTHTEAIISIIQDSTLPLPDSLPVSISYLDFCFPEIYSYLSVYPRQCKTSSANQSVGLSILRSSIWFWQKLKKNPRSQIYMNLSYIDPQASVLNYCFK